jgi:two-component sensor histidine kinase
MMMTDFVLNYQRMPQASMTLDRELKFKNANEAYCRAVARDKEDLIGKFLFEEFPDTAERIQPFLDALRKTLDGDIARLEQQPYKLLLPDGRLEDRLWDIENQPLYSMDGDIIGVVQYCEDVTEREALRKERDLVAAELMHRVRNTMSVVQSVAEHTVRASDTLDDFHKGFTGRLMSMSRNFTMLSETNWRGLDLETVLRTELQPYLGADSDKIAVRGDAFTLSIKSTKDAAMIFHELTTNAVKYGFLSVPDGKLDVSWDFVDGALKVFWKESGLKDLKPPTRKGFGFELMEMFPNLGLEKTFERDGLKISARIPATISEGQITFGHST